MKPWDVVYALSSTTKRLEKEGILSKLDAENEFWPGAQLTFDSMVTFGVKKLPEVKSHASFAPNNWKMFRELADSLAKRKLTGNAARDAIVRFAESCSKPQWEYWYSRILEKDLDCGAKEAITNKFAPKQYQVDPFACQLATDMNKVATTKLPKTAYLEAKYDGMRTLWFITKRVVEDEVFGDSLAYDVKAFSRSGKELHNFSDVAAQLGLMAKLDGFPDCGIVIDGEVISGSFNELMTQAHRKTDAKFSGVLMAFDILTVDDFLAKKRTASLRSRRQVLEHKIEELSEMIIGAGSQPLVQVSTALKDIDPVSQRDIIMDFFQQQLDAGFEGIIVKDADASYEWDRTTSWLKLKPTDTWDLIVSRCEEGDGRLKGSLGAIFCEGRDNEGRLISVSVGGGLSDSQRKEIWANRDKVIGHTVEVMADAVSRNQDGTYSLRFPRFVRFRDDK